MGDEQDMRKMGGLRKRLPVTFWCMTAAVLAIGGFWPFAGFFSKDAILYAAYLQGTSGKVLWFVGLVTALLTSFYMFRLWYLTFMGEPRSEVAHHHATPSSMLVPCVILAVLACCGGWIGIERFAAFLAPAIGPRTVEAGSAGLELRMSVAAVAVALLGWYIAHVFYKLSPSRPAELAAELPAGYKLLSHKYYVDEFYGAAIIKPLLAFSTYILDWVVDRALLGGAAWILSGIAKFCGAILQRWQSGNLRSYAGWLAAGVAAMLLFILLPWSGVLAAWFGIHLNLGGH
jgi:NADH-quinone oxidoreductase subunit L